MIHTCCEKEERDFECTCNQVSTGPKDDNQHLEYILETNVLIYTKLRARFDGDLGNFLQAWWAAVDLFLPRDDTYDLITGWSAKKALRRWHVLPGVGKLHRSHDEFNEAKIWTVVEYYFSVVGSVTELFDCETNAVELHPDSSDAEKTLSNELYQYLFWLNVPLPIIEWLNGSSRAGPPLGFVPSRGYKIVHETLSGGEPMKREWIKDSIIPLVTAGVITDLNEGREIPKSLYEQLEGNGVIAEGRLRPLEEQEDIFEQSMEFLRL